MFLKMNYGQSIKSNFEIAVTSHTFSAIGLGSILKIYLANR